MIRVGPAGWSYADWDGKVYPRSRPSGFHPLSFLARYVECVEVNSTFYAFPELETCANWARLVEDRPEFRFTLKLPRDFTHRERAHAEEEIARDFLRRIEPLRRARKLSALLVQFPLSFQHGAVEVRRLGVIHALFSELPLVLELRHASWFEPAALLSIDGLGYSLAHIDLPRAWNHPPIWHEPIGPLGYFRLHGRNSATWFEKNVGRDAKYDYLYGPDEIGELAARAQRLARGREETFVITNNHFVGKAVVNAIELLAELRHARVPAPADLVRAYPELASVARADGQGELF